MLLADWLTKNAMSATQFADAINSSKSSVSRWINGDVRPDWDVLGSIVKFTNGEVTANDFLPDDAKIAASAGSASAVGNTELPEDAAA